MAGDHFEKGLSFGTLLSIVPEAIRTTGGLKENPTVKKICSWKVEKNP